MSGKMNEINNIIKSIPEFKNDEYLMKSISNVKLTEESEISEKILLGRGPMDEYCIFIVGPPSLIIRLGGAQERIKSANVMLVDKDDETKSLHGIMIVFPKKSLRDFGYLLMQISEVMKEKKVSVESICVTIRPFLYSLIDSGDILDEKQQIGLMGELILLRDLINIANETKGLTIKNALDCWQRKSESSDNENNATMVDFESQLNIKIEVKSTMNPTRIHTISRWRQIMPIGNDQLYLFSVSVIPNKGDESLRLYDIVHEILEVISQEEGAAISDTIQNYQEKLGISNFHWKHQESYALASTFRIDKFEPSLILIDDNLDILRDDSFIENKGPKSEIIVDDSIGYDLDLSGGNIELIGKNSEKYREVLKELLQNSD